MDRKCPIARQYIADITADFVESMPRAEMERGRARARARAHTHTHTHTHTFEGGPKNNWNLSVARELEVVARCAARCRESTQYSSSLPRGVNLG